VATRATAHPRLAVIALGLAATVVAARVAHLVTGRMLDYIEFEDDYALVKTRAPAEAVGRSLGDSQLRRKYNVTVVAIKRPGEGFTYATADTVVRHGDVLIVAGHTSEVERVANLA
jgi:trk system potassium uptake protein